MVTVAMAFPDGRGGQAGRCRHTSGTHLPKLAAAKRLQKLWIRTFPRKNRFISYTPNPSLRRSQKGVTPYVGAAASVLRSGSAVPGQAYLANIGANRQRIVDLEGSFVRHCITRRKVGGNRQ